MISVVIAVAVVLIDQFTKYEVLNFLGVNDILIDGKSVTVIDKVLRFTYVKNFGAGFGIFASQRWVFMLLSVVIISVIVFAIVKYANKSLVFSIIMGMLFGGGIGNMIDRIRLGFVIDFIDVICVPYWKWVFNFADCAVTVGGIWLVVYILFFDKVFTDNSGTGSGENNE